jgi:hypothetical protein
MPGKVNPVIPEAGNDRAPDVWLFNLSAATEVGIRLTGGMQGRLLRVAENTEEAASLLPTGGWHGRLRGGAYRLEVTSSRINNLVPYEVAVHPQALVQGLTRRVTAPARISVAVGNRDLLEISSLGSTDVRARLLDSAGRLVTSGDDREGDWNFLLAARLDPGAYTLEIDPVGTTTGLTEVRMDSRREIDHPALELPAVVDVDPGTSVHLFPVPSAGAEMLLATARSRESVGLAVEEEHHGSWRAHASDTGREVQVGLPLAAGSPLRLRLWSMDLRGNPAELAVTALTPRHVSEAELASGVTLETVAGANAGVAAIDLERPGTFRLGPGVGGVLWSSSPGRPLEPTRNGLLPAAGTVLWVAAVGRSPSVRASRVTLGSGDSLQVPVGDTPAPVDLRPEGSRYPKTPRAPGRRVVRGSIGRIG